MNSPLFFVFAETLVAGFQIAFGTFLACVAVGLLIVMFSKPEELGD